MKHHVSTLVLLLFVSLSYFILPHSLVPQKASADVSQNIKPTQTSFPTVIEKQNTLLVPRLSPIEGLTVTPTAIPTISNQSTIEGLTLDDIQTYLLTQINDYRKLQGLSEVVPNTTVCTFANIRAAEITSNFSHDGFTSRINNKTLPYTSYTAVTENIAMTSNYQDVVTMWKNSAGHAENMRANTPYVCIGHSGNYYAYEGWRP